MRFLIVSVWIGLLPALPAVCDQAPGNVSQAQLMQLNRASQQELQNIQRQSGVADGAPSAQQQSATRQLDRQQKLEQQALQERQRQDLLMHNARTRTIPTPGMPPNLQAIQRQQQYRHQQRGQLNRFRTEQGIRNR